MRSEDWQTIQLNDDIRASRPFVVSSPLGEHMLLRIRDADYEVRNGDVVQVLTDGSVLRNGALASPRT